MRSLKMQEILQGSILLLIIISMLFGTFDNASAGSQTKNQKTTFEKGRILDTGGNKIYFSWIDIGRRPFVYEPIGSRRDTTIRDDEIIRIEVQKGSHALEGFFWGGVVGLGVITLIDLLVEDRSSGEGWKIEWTHSLPLFCGVGGVIGMWEGAGHPKYTEIYPSPNANWDNLPKSRSCLPPSLENVQLFRFTLGF